MFARPIQYRLRSADSPAGAGHCIRGIEHSAREGQANQLATLDHIGLFDAPLATPPAMALVYPPASSSASLEARAKAYLHSNCSQCHVEAGGGNAMIDLEFTAKLERMKVVDVAPQHDAFGLKDARLIAPGRPEASVLLHRMGCRGPGQMPPLATSLVDEAAVQMLREWVRGMKN